MTLLEFDMYRSVRWSEMVGTLWMKANKHLTSPNIMRVTTHNTKVSVCCTCCISNACFTS